MRTIYFIRHGETEWNKEGRYQGWLNSPLTKIGREQAHSLRGQIDVDIVFCSDLGRAVETATLAFPNHPHMQLQDLREIYLGQWQGKKIADLQADKNFQTYIQHPAQFQPQSQESFQQVTARMQRALTEILRSNAKTIAIVGHGVSLYCLMLSLAGQKLETFEHKWMLQSCSMQAFYIKNKKFTIVNQK